MQALAYVILPLAIPGLIAVGLFAFLASWNEFLYASAFVQKNVGRLCRSGYSTLPRRTHVSTGER